MSHWPASTDAEEWAHLREEQIAIKQHCGGLPPDQADYEGRKEIATAWRAQVAAEAAEETTT